MSADKMDEAREFYGKFESIHNQVHSSLINALSKPFIKPKVYFRGTGIMKMNYAELATDISDYLASRGVALGDDFRDKLFYSFLSSKKGSKPARQALMDMEFGRIWGDSVTDLVFEQFSDVWMAYYSLTGMGAGHFGGYDTGYRLTKRNLMAWDTPHIIAWAGKRGIARLNRYEKQLGKTLPHRKDIEAIVEYALNPNRDQLAFELV